MNIKLILTQIMATCLISAKVEHIGSMGNERQIFGFENFLDCTTAKERLEEFTRRDKIGIQANSGVVRGLKFFSEVTCLSDDDAKYKVIDKTYFSCKTDPCETMDEDYHKARLLAC